MTSDPAPRANRAHHAAAEAAWDALEPILWDHSRPGPMHPYARRSIDEKRERCLPDMARAISDASRAPVSSRAGGSRVPTGGASSSPRANRAALELLRELRDELHSCVTTDPLFLLTDAEQAAFERATQGLDAALAQIEEIDDE